MPPDISSLVTSPLLYGALVVAGWLLWLIERLIGANGIFTRLNTWWSKREVNRLVREKEVREARLALDQLEETAVVRSLRRQLSDLEVEMEWYRRDRMDQNARDHHRADFDRALAQWVAEWVPKARARGLDIPDPPRFVELPEMIQPRWPGAGVADRRGLDRRNPNTNPQGRRALPPLPPDEEDGDEGGQRIDPRASTH